MEERQLQQLVIVGLGLTIIVGLALVMGLVLSRWGDPNRGADTRLNQMDEIPDSYDRTEMALIGSETERSLGHSWEPLGNPSTAYKAYVGYGCASCHGLAGRGAVVGGPVAGLDGDIIRFFVRTGPGSMPAYSTEDLPEESLDAIIQWSSGQEPDGGAIPRIPHNLEGRADCLLCHDIGGIRPFPPDHAGRGIDVCLVCHKPAEVTPATPTPEPTPPSMTLTPTPTPTSPPGGKVPAIPHTLDGRSNCLLCHDTGSIRPFPADHAGRSSDICLSCHQPVERPATTPTATPVTTPTPAVTPSPGSTPTPVITPTATPTPVRYPTPTREPDGGVPVIPHGLEGRSDCLLCHNIGSIEPFPQSHVGRSNDICLLCHQPE